MAHQLDLSYVQICIHRDLLDHVNLDTLNTEVILQDFPLPLLTGWNLLSKKKPLQNKDLEFRKRCH